MGHFWLIPPPDAPLGLFCTTGLFQTVSLAYEPFEFKVRVVPPTPVTQGCAAGSMAFNVVSGDWLL